MNITIIKAKVERKELIFSIHAEEERMDEGLTAREVIAAILNDEILNSILIQGVVKVV